MVHVTVLLISCCIDISVFRSPRDGTSLEMTRDARLVTTRDAGVMSNVPDDRSDSVLSTSVVVVVDDRRRPLRDIYLMILTLGVMYLMVCAGYGTFETLQSTINVEGGLGTTAIGTLYATAIISSLLLAPTIVAKLGPRLTLFVGWTVQALYSVANSFPQWGTLVPASAAVGTMFAATSIVYGVYVTTLAEHATWIRGRPLLRGEDDQMSTTTDENTGKRSRTAAGRHLPRAAFNSRRIDNTVVLINSVLLAFVNAGSITGSLIGSLVVGSSSIDHSSSGVNSLTTSDVLSSTTTTGIVGCLATSNSSRCGTDHCPFVAEHIAAFTPSDRRLVYIVGTVSFAFNVIALLITAVILKAPPGTPTSSSSSLLSSMSSCCGCTGDGHLHRERHSVTSDTAQSSTAVRSAVDVEVDNRRTSKALLGDDDAHGGVSRGDVAGQVDYVASRTITLRQRIIGTFRLLADHRLQLLIPSVVLMGVVQSFSVGAFNQSFIGCFLGVHFIGYATLCFRGSLITCSLLTGQLVRYINRRTLILIAKLLMVANICTWFVRLPYPSWSASDRVLVPAAVMAWCTANGAVYGVLRTTVFGLFPRLFRRDLDFALAHANIWESFGAAVTFFVNDWFCFDVKAFALIALTAVSVATYITLECVMCDVDAATTSSLGDVVVVVGEEKYKALSDEVSQTPFVSVTLLNDLHGDGDDAKS